MFPQFIVFIVAFVLTRIKLIVIFSVFIWLLKLMTNKQELQNIYQFSYLLWCIIYFMGIHRDDQIRMAAYVVFPCFIIFQAYRQINSIIKYYRSDGREKTVDLNTSYVFSIVTMMIYAFMLRYEQRKEEHQRNKTLPANPKMKLLTQNAEDKDLRKEIVFNLAQLLNIVRPTLRYLALLSAIYAGLMNINLPNSVLILWSFILMNNPNNDFIQWPRYFCFMIFLILNLYISRVFDGKFRTLNVEIISVFGTYAHNEALCRPY